MLIHSPYQIARINVLKELKCNKDINLILSGHMHGGLVPDFIRRRKEHFFGLAGPYATLLPRFSSGLYNGKNPLIISGGLTKISSESGLGFITKNVVFKTVLDRWLFPPEYYTLNISNGADSVERRFRSYHDRSRRRHERPV